MGAAGIWVGVLGPLQVRSADIPVVIPGQRPSIVLASLAVSAGRTVGLRTLAHHVWGEHMPVSPKRSLHSLVMRLRRAVGPAVIRTMPAGYLMDIDPDHVDLLRFRQLVLEAGSAQGAEKARLLLGEALGLWRDEPLAGLDCEAWRHEVLPGLLEEHLAVLERRIDFDLTAGRYGGLVPELRELVSRHPLRETFWRQLITAQDECGLHADALDTYHQLRTELRERLGVDPSRDLQDLYQRLLESPTTAPDGSNVRPHQTHAPAVTSRTPPGRNELPRDIADFSGRHRELEQLLAAASPRGDAARTVMISAIDGMAGVGKTTVAVHLAHLLAADYPDGQLFIDLRGHTPEHSPVEPEAALEHLLRAVDVPGESIPAEPARRAALWRAELAGRKVLVLLDNAATADQVLPLIPGTAGCLAVVTSRRRLAELDGAHVQSLDILPEPDAFALFTAVVGADRTAAEPAATAEVLRLCGYLPLAIRIAAARFRARPTWSVEHLAARLRTRQRPLAELDVGERGVGAAFALSYEHLPAALQRMFRLLGLFPGTSFDAYLAAALAQIDLPEAEELLEDLLDAHLLRQPAPDRYQFHDLLRQHAHATAHRDESAESCAMAVHRLVDYYLSVAYLLRGHSHIALISPPAAIDPGCPPARLPALADRDQALAWADGERANLGAILAHAAEHGWDEHVCQVANAVWWYFRFRGHLHDWITTQHIAVAAAERLGDTRTQADMERILGVAYWEASRSTDAIHHYEKALDLYRQLGDLGWQSITLSNLGLVHWRHGRYEEALAYHRQALACSRGTDANRREEANILANLGLACWSLGRYEEALEHHEQALDFSRHEGNDRGPGKGGPGDRGPGIRGPGKGGPGKGVLYDRIQAEALTNLGLVHGSLAHPDKALDYHHQAIEMIRASDDRVGESDFLNDLGETLRTLGQPEQARTQYEQALLGAEQANSRWQQARAHNGLAWTLRTTDPSGARDHWQAALALYTDLDNPEADRIREVLDADA